MWKVQEVADYLGIHANTVKRISPEELPYVKVVSRGDRRYDPRDVERYRAARWVLGPA